MPVENWMTLLKYAASLGTDADHTAPLKAC